MKQFLHRHWANLLLWTGLVVYILIAGRTRSCPACTVVTDLFGISGG